MKTYLASTDVIDWQEPSVFGVAKRLSLGINNKLEIAKICFDFVRDEIKHSSDFQIEPVTCRASDVLRFQTGFCFAKSHLLAALLRANGIPAGLCYQRLLTDADRNKFCLHGFNAALFQSDQWFRFDARGNHGDIQTEFEYPNEQLAFKLTSDGELTLSDLHAEPLPEVINALTQYNSCRELERNLPDLERSF